MYCCQNVVVPAAPVSLNQTVRFARLTYKAGASAATTPSGSTRPTRTEPPEPPPPVRSSIAPKMRCRMNQRVSDGVGVWPRAKNVGDAISLPFVQGIPSNIRSALSLRRRNVSVRFGFRDGSVPKRLYRAPQILAQINQRVSCTWLISPPASQDGSAITNHVGVQMYFTFIWITFVPSDGIV